MFLPYAHVYWLPIIPHAAILYASFYSEMPQFWLAWLADSVVSKFSELFAPFVYVAQLEKKMSEGSTCCLRSVGRMLRLCFLHLCIMFMSNSIMLPSMLVYYSFFVKKTSFSFFNLALLVASAVNSDMTVPLPKKKTPKQSHVRQIYVKFSCKFTDALFRPRMLLRICLHFVLL